MPTDPVRADGNRMHGSAMPVSTPYILTASGADIPYRMRQEGMDAASMLWSSVRAVRFAVSGTEKASSSRREERMRGNVPRALRLPAGGLQKTGDIRRRTRMEYKAAASSPVTTPAAARRIEGVRPDARRDNQRRTVVRIRTACSVSWPAAGSFASPSPRLRPQIQLWTAAKGRA